MTVELSRLALVVLACLSFLAAPIASISFKVVPDVKKCLREEVHKDVLVVGEYTLTELEGQRTDIMVHHYGRE